MLTHIVMFLKLQLQSSIMGESRGYYTDRTKIPKNDAGDMYQCDYRYKKDFYTNLFFIAQSVLYNQNTCYLFNIKQKVNK